MRSPRERNLVNTVQTLGQRIACNRAASADFDAFVLGLLEPEEGDVALDLGPGLGKQLLPVAERAGHVVGLDVSPHMVAALRRKVSRTNVKLIVGSMDDLPAVVGDCRFTCVYAVYSLYYSANPGRLIPVVARMLDGPRARFVVVAPDLGNNEAWFADLSRMFPLPSDVIETSRIARTVFLPALLEAFPIVTQSVFRSAITFTTLDELIAYYDGCQPYCRADRRAEAAAFFRRRFEQDGQYRIDKRSLALVGRP